MGNQTEDNRRSLYAHIALAPVGAMAATWLLLGFSDAGWIWWGTASNLVQAGQVIPLGTIAYGTLAALVDGVVKMVFYALAQRQSEIDKRHREGRLQLLQELIDHKVPLPPDLRKEAEKLGLLEPAAGRA